MKPNTCSATEVTKPALACVTSTPALLAAATSTLRMSIAQRRNATSLGRRSNTAAGPGDWRYETMRSQSIAARIRASPSRDGLS